MKGKLTSQLRPALSGLAHAPGWPTILCLILPQCCYRHDGSCSEWTWDTCMMLPPPPQLREGEREKWTLPSCLPATHVNVVEWRVWVRQQQGWLRSVSALMQKFQIAASSLKRQWDFFYFFKETGCLELAPIQATVNIFSSMYGNIYSSVETVGDTENGKGNICFINDIVFFTFLILINSEWRSKVNNQVHKLD